MISKDDIEGFQEHENPKELFRYERNGPHSAAPDTVLLVRKLGAYPGFVQIQIRDMCVDETISMLVPQHVIDELKKVI